MPERVDAMPGRAIDTMPWTDMLDGEPWVITAEEMNELGVKLESVRAYAHSEAANNGKKFRTRQVDGNLYLQAR